MCESDQEGRLLVVMMGLMHMAKYIERLVVNRFEESTASKYIAQPTATTSSRQSV